MRARALACVRDGIGGAPARRYRETVRCSPAMTRWQRAQSRQCSSIARRCPGVSSSSMYRDNRLSSARHRAGGR